MGWSKSWGFKGLREAVGAKEGAVLVLIGVPDILLEVIEL